MKLIVRALLMIVGFAWFFTAAETPAWYWFFAIVLGSVLLSEMLFFQKQQKKTRKQVQSSAKKKPTPKNSSNKSKKTNEQILHTPLEELNGSEFERLVAMYYEEKGYTPQLVGGAGDHEVDIILTDPKENYKIAVQCKHWKTKKVGNDTILRLASGKRVHKCIDAWCITTNYYTKAAMEAAEANKVKLLNGLHVQDQIVKWQESKLISTK